MLRKCSLRFGRQAVELSPLAASYRLPLPVYKPLAMNHLECGAWAPPFRLKQRQYQPVENEPGRPTRLTERIRTVPINAPRETDS
jgi:hypothetical protein